MNPTLALQIAMVFGLASLQSVGGGNAIIPELQAQTVVQHGWLTPQQFADSFAIAQVAPGPSSLVVTLLGYRIAGIGGALLATVAMLLPASLLMAVVARVWSGTADRRWHAVLEAGLAPVAVGLVASSGLVVGRSVDASAMQWGISAAATLALVATRTSPLAVVFGGGAVAIAVHGLA